MPFLKSLPIGTILSLFILALGITTAHTENSYAELSKACEGKLVIYLSPLVANVYRNGEIIEQTEVLCSRKNIDFAQALTEVANTPGLFTAKQKREIIAQGFNICKYLSYAAQGVLRSSDLIDQSWDLISASTTNEAACIQTVKLLKSYYWQDLSAYYYWRFWANRASGIGAKVRAALSSAALSGKSISVPDHLMNGIDSDAILSVNPLDKETIKGSNPYFSRFDLN